MLMYVLDRTTFLGPFGMNQMSYVHFGQDQMITNPVSVFLA